MSNCDFIPFLLKPFDDHIKIKDKLLKLLDEQTGTSFVNEYDKITKTDWYNNDGQQKHYWKFFYSNISEFIKKILVNNFMFKQDEFSEKTITNYWFQQYYNGDTHDWHTHPGTKYNIVYYVELPNDAPVTEFKSPITNEVISIKANEGDVLIFPSFLLHRSPKNKSQQRKTVIAFNV